MAAERVERRLAAVLAADVAGYSRLMGTDEVGTLTALKAHRREIVDPSIAAHNGRIVKTTGDGMLVEFASAVDAVTCAVAVQEKMAERTAEGAVPRIQFRVGINVGDIIIDGDDIFGDGVNVAARVENECEPGGVYLSDDAYRQVRGKVTFAIEDVGERLLKNIDRPVRLYAVRSSAYSAEATANSPAEGKPLPLPDKPSIAVLPFTNMSGDPEQEYFADGMVEDIITALSRFKSLFVIARNSSFTYKGKAIDIKQVGRELGVRYVLEGSVRKAGGRLRITGQLIEAATGAHLWADKIDGLLEEVFDLQDRVAQEVAAAIGAKLQETEMARVQRKPTENMDAYDCFLRSLAIWSPGDRDANDEALALARKAFQLDPQYGRAYARAAMCYIYRKQGHWMTDRDTEVSEAMSLARLALKYGSDDEYVLYHVAVVFAFIGEQLDAAVALADQAIALNPNNANCWTNSGLVRCFRGEHHLAIEHGNRAMRLSPRDYNRSNMLLLMSLANLFLHHFEDAERFALEIVTRSPNHLTSLQVLAASSAFQNNSGLARETAARILCLDPTFRVSKLRDLVALRRPEDLATYMEGLRLAGIPE